MAHDGAGRAARAARAALGALLAVCCVGAWSCGAAGGGAGDAGGTGRDVPAGADAAADTTAPTGGAWRLETVSTGLLEPPLRLAAGPDGRLWAAGLRHTGTAPGCTLAEPPGPVQTYQVVVLGRDAADGGPGTWTEEPVATLDGGFGLGLTVDSLGDPLVAWMGGTPGEEFCGGSDLLVAGRGPAGSWTTATVQAVSAVAGVTCGAMQDVCNTGDVTGMWPALGADGDGRPVVAFRDVHFGYTKEDYDSSDLEVARRGGAGWEVWTVDDSSGAGRASAVAADPESGRVFVAYTNPKDALLRLATLGVDGTWTRETIATGAAASGSPALVVVGGAPAVAAHDPGAGTLVWFERDAAGVWTRTTVDADGRTGLDPSAAVCPDGRVQVAYRRCGRLGTDECQPARDGLRVATRAAGGWAVATVAADDEHEDGLTPAMVCDAVLYATRRFDPVSGAAVGALRLATWVAAAGAGPAL